MDQNFQTSFIPKKPIVQKSFATPKIGFFAVVSIFVFFAMVLSYGGLYFYKGLLAKSIVSKQDSLGKAENGLGEDVIKDLQLTDKRLRVSSTVLAKHISVTPIFEVLSELTMKSVRYTKFNYELGANKDPRIKVSLSGQANTYHTVAQQGYIFSGNKHLIDPAFSNLSLDDKGNVSFELEFFVDPSFVNFREDLKTRTEKKPAILPSSAPAGDSLLTEELEP